MYKLTKHNSIQRLADNASIPNDPANRDYAEYLEWVAAGNTPGPAQTQAEIDAEIAEEESSKARANLSKLRADIFPDVLAFLATIGGVPKVIKDASILAATEKLKIK
jgi:hypothetical protein